MKRAIYSILLVAFLAIVPFQRAAADVDDFTIHDFRGRYELLNDTPGGRMRVDETLRLTFTDQNHGILRALPKSYKNTSVKLKILSVTRDGSSEPYTSYEENGNEVLKIGDANKTITGRHMYEIQYEMQAIMSFQDGHDEWYWDINGDQWKQPFENVTAEVIFPEGWQDSGLPEASCYTGTVGANEQSCAKEKTAQGYKIVTTRTLQANETLTIAIPAQKGLFTPRSTMDWVRDNVWQLAGITTGIVVSFWCFKQWWRYGKDHKGRGVIVPEYQAPKGLSPAEAGLLMDYRVDGRDLTATIIDLAVRGFLRIHDEEKKQFGLFKQHEFSLELVKSTFTQLKSHEKDLLEAIFDPVAKGTIQKLSSLDRTKMYQTVQTIKKSLKQTLVEKHGLIEQTPMRMWIKLIGLIAVMLALLVLGKPGWGWGIGFSLAIASAVLFGALMQRRSHAGVEMYEKLQGLKRYMNTAEKDRLRMLQSVDRPYAEPAKTVKLFEKLLPFAVALGVEKSWAKQFDGLYTQAPGWYSGTGTAFHAAYFASSLGSSVSALNSSFSQSTSSGSSGSGGGGSAGGGDGGGGGGGW